MVRHTGRRTNTLTTHTLVLTGLYCQKQPLIKSHHRLQTTRCQTTVIYCTRPHQVLKFWGLRIYWYVSGSDASKIKSLIYTHGLTLVRLISGWKIYIYMYMCWAAAAVGAEAPTPVAHQESQLPAKQTRTYKIKKVVFLSLRLTHTQKHPNPTQLATTQI